MGMARGLGDGLLRLCNGAWRDNDGDAVDIVEVVRCKDCKYAENMMPINNSNGYLMGDCTLRKEDDIIVTAWEDEFCSYGERKDNG